ncbi:HlyU family transcriptional regulator [Roseobacter sinensis]|uniref:HlyU family transcriptional regulator n=1 Tax=Roseobacter sinensis TaxID=2931391 RepID=A0ABT3BGA7_9RHOB|nr:HlyU family transcriptional regulator [Roseobacter sp. WL0113]MCV3272614.1 HlyU family transcriptional regulator [Roseobacter sp. WL0113]
MQFLKKLLGGGDNSEAKASSETYEGFQITPTPIAEGNTYRVAATIEKEVDGEMKAHKLVRADTLQGLEEAQAACIRKAKQVIDEQGERIFR